MQNDLADVLRDPLRFARIKARHVLNDPLAVPGKTLNYAKYDVVHMLNSLMEALRPRSVVVRAARGQGDGGAGAPVPAVAAGVVPGVGGSRSRGAARARHVSEPDPRAVAAG